MSVIARSENDEAISFFLDEQGDCFLSGWPDGRSARHTVATTVAMTYYLVSELRQ